MYYMYVCLHICYYNVDGTGVINIQAAALSAPTAARQCL